MANGVTIKKFHRLDIVSSFSVIIDALKRSTGLKTPTPMTGHLVKLGYCAVSSPSASDGTRQFCCMSGASNFSACDSDAHFVQFSQDQDQDQDHIGLVAATTRPAFSRDKAGP